MKAVLENVKRELPYAALVLVIGIIALCFCEIQIAKATAIAYNIEMWVDGSNILDFFFPLFVSLPFTWKLYFERKDGFLNYVAVRTNQTKYIFKKIVAGMIVVFFMTFLLYYAGLVFSIVFIQPEMVVSDTRLYEYLFGKAQAETPLIFGIFWCMWKGFIGSIICAFGYGISLVIDNLFVIAMTPFLYCIIENFITGTLNLEQYSVCTAYILDRLSPKGMGISNYFIGVITFAVLGSIIIGTLYYKKSQRNSYE